MELGNSVMIASYIVEQTTRMNSSVSNSGSNGSLVIVGAHS